MSGHSFDYGINNPDTLNHSDYRVIFDKEYKVLALYLSQEVNNNIYYIADFINLSHSEIDQFDIILTNKKSFSGIPEWWGAFAIKKTNEIILKSPEITDFIYSYKENLIHEMIHLLLHFKKIDDTPIWFEEGLITYLSHNLSDHDLFLLFWYSVFNSNLILKYPSEKYRARIFYIQSQLIVEHLIGKGENNFKNLLHSISISKNFEKSFFYTYTYSVDTFLKEYKNKKKYISMRTLFLPGNIYIMITLLFILSVTIYSVRKRIKMNKMKNQELEIQCIDEKERLE